ncbi:MAG: hypothetical protein LBD63_02815 [Mycoplasmataceae bacterium]|nr:hypothetical protein [Mycoplasmataceae bacterium]
MLDIIHNIQLSAHASMYGASSSPAWVWVWLSNLIGSDSAAVVQYIIMVAVYGSAIFLIGVQIFRLMHNWGDRNHKDMQKRETARENCRAAFVIIAVIAVIAGIGFSAVCFFLNKFIGQ